jgi:hypothetical protein
MCGYDLFIFIVIDCFIMCMYQIAFLSIGREYFWHDQYCTYVFISINNIDYVYMYIWIIFLKCNLHLTK